MNFNLKIHKGSSGIHVYNLQMIKYIVYIIPLQGFCSHDPFGLSRRTILINGGTVETGKTAIPAYLLIY